MRVAGRVADRRRNKLDVLFWASHGWSAALGATPDSPDWKSGAAMSLLAALYGGNDLVSAFERVTIRRDLEKRISRNSHVAVNPFPIVQLKDCLTGDEFALGVAINSRLPVAGLTAVQIASP